MRAGYRLEFGTGGSRGSLPNIGPNFGELDNEIVLERCKASALKVLNTVFTD